MYSFYEDQRLTFDKILAIRTLLIGFEQGAQLKNLKNNLDIQKMFEEKVSPVDKAFENNYLSVLRIRRTFDKPSKELILLAVKVIIVLKCTTFFGGLDEDGVCHVSESYRLSSFLPNDRNNCHILCFPFSVGLLERERIIYYRSIDKSFGHNKSR